MNEADEYSVLEIGTGCVARGLAGVVSDAPCGRVAGEAARHHFASRGRGRSDCTALELATMLEIGLEYVAHFGTAPAQGLRSQEWDHYGGTQTGDRFAEAWVCMRLPENPGQSEEVVEIPADLSGLDLLSGGRFG